MQIKVFLADAIIRKASPCANKKVLKNNVWINLKLVEIRSSNHQVLQDINCFVCQG
jgi:hypothetical protein